jgi:putative redox protein
VTESRLVASALVEGKSGYAQAIRSGRHTLTADEPATAGGTETGPTPYGLLLAALGACTSITLRMYAERKGWELGTIEVSLRFFREGDEGRVERELRFSAPLDDAQRARLLEISEKTPVTLTLKRGTPIHTVLSTLR